MCWFLSLVHRANGNDGPKWTCGIQLLKQPCIIFSLGCNNLIDFESEMYKWGQCTVHVFDPTVDGSIAPSLKQQAGATLHLLGLGTPGQVRYHSLRLLLSCIAVATVLVLMLCLPRPPLRANVDIRFLFPAPLWSHFAALGQWGAEGLEGPDGSGECDGLHRRAKGW